MKTFRRILHGCKPYMDRFYLLGKPYMADGSSPFDERGTLRPEALRPPGISVFLNRIWRSDARPELHNHPWVWAFAIILWGGYWEERLVVRTQDVVRRWRGPGSIVRLNQNDFHRVDLPAGKKSYSLFVAGPLHGKSWCFRANGTGPFIPHRKYGA